MKFGTVLMDFARPFLVVVAGLYLTAQIELAMSEREPGTYTTLWLLSPFFAFGALLAIGYLAGRVVSRPGPDLRKWVVSTLSGFLAVAAGAVVFVAGLVVVFADDWPGDTDLDLQYAYLFVGPIVLAPMIVTFVIARALAAKRAVELARAVRRDPGDV